MIVKIFVDRHNIRYFHEESSIDSSVHLAATHYFVFASFLQLIALLLFAIIESEKGHIACASVYLILALYILWMKWEQFQSQNYLIYVVKC